MQWLQYRTKSKSQYTAFPKRWRNLRVPTVDIDTFFVRESHHFEGVNIFFYQKSDELITNLIIIRLVISSSLYRHKIFYFHTWPWWYCRRTCVFNIQMIFSHSLDILYEWIISETRYKLNEFNKKNIIERITPRVNIWELKHTENLKIWRLLKVQPNERIFHS